MWLERLIEQLGVASRVGLAARVDLARRADPAELPELMDSPGTYEELKVCLRDLESINRVTFGYRPTLAFLDRVLAGRGAGAAPVEVLDIGFGYGDMLRAVRRGALRRRLPVRLVGIELQPWAAQVATEANRRARVPEGEITWTTGNVLEQATTSPPDVVVSSLVMHHLRDGEIVELLRWMERTARVGWFVSDLERVERPYRWFGVLARAMRWHPYVRHDGPVSFRRAFREDDWTRLLGEAGIGGARVFRVAPARLCVERIRH